METETSNEPRPAEHEVATRAVSPSLHAMFWFAIGCASLAVVQLPLALAARPQVTSGETHEPASSSGAPSPMPSDSVAPPIASASPRDVVDDRPKLVDDDAPPLTFRIAQLEGDAAFEIASAKVGKRGCEQALGSLGLSRRDFVRADAAMAKLRHLTGCHATDRVSVAFAKSDHHLRALELETAPGDFVLVHERSLVVSSNVSDVSSVSDAPEGEAADDAGVAAAAARDGGELLVEHVVLPTSHRRHAVALTIDTDLPAAIATSGLDPSIADSISEALRSRADVGALQKGTVLRVVADATYVAGRFDRYDELVAIELRRDDGPPIRLYHQPDAAAHGGASWYDGKGHQPMQAKWRLPLAGARVTSRFNPRRMHPVLHTIMPHNGCDFAASPGTPVYSIGAGVVSFRGESGPSGNLVMIAHDGGYESGYAHLSRFVPSVTAGTRVEAHTLIGYSGTTGRSTGPHLHLSVKKNGVFIDPLSLKLDAVRVVPPGERTAFDARKADADAALDSIRLPAVAGEAAPSASASGAPAEAASASDGDDDPSLDEDQK